MEIVYTSNPFKSVMVDTCITIAQKQKVQDYNFKFLDFKQRVNNKKEYIANDKIYKDVANNAFFIPTEFNLKVYEKICRNTKKLIEKYKVELDEYRQSLKVGDITLLGLITEGGQGLVTANNGKYIGVLEGTKWAKKIQEERLKKLWLFFQNKKPKELKHLKSKQDVEKY